MDLVKLTGEYCSPIGALGDEEREFGELLGGGRPSWRTRTARSPRRRSRTRDAPTTLQLEAVEEGGVGGRQTGGGPPGDLREARDLETDGGRLRAGDGGRREPGPLPACWPAPRIPTGRLDPGMSRALAYTMEEAVGASSPPPAGSSRYRLRGGRREADAGSGDGGREWARGSANPSFCEWGTE
jgi:hypothetical protein